MKSLWEAPWRDGFIDLLEEGGVNVVHKSVNGVESIGQVLQFIDRNPDRMALSRSAGLGAVAPEGSDRDMDELRIELSDFFGPEANGLHEGGIEGFEEDVGIGHTSWVLAQRPSMGVM